MSVTILDHIETIHLVIQYQHNTRHQLFFNRITVVKGFLAKVVQDSKNRVLGEGDHMIESTDFEFVGYEDVTKTHCIQHGTFWFCYP